MERGHSTVRAVVRSLEQTEAMVQVEGGGCGRCHEAGGCGGNNLTQMFCAGPKTYRVANPIGALVDDRVIVEIGPGSVSRSANLAYGIPLGLVLLFALLGSRISGDPGAMFGAGVGFALGMTILRLKTGRGTRNQANQPHIISRI